jgi:hypothetical protein
VTISSPVALRAYVGSGAAFAFTATQVVLFANNPAVGAAFQIGALGALVAYTFVASGPTGNQVLRGATLDATLDNLVAKLNAAGYLCTNVGSGYLQIIIPSSIGVGPAYDQYQVAGAAYMTIPAAGSFGYFYGAGGTYVPAGVPVTLPATANDQVATLGAPGITTSDPAAGNGATVTWTT